MEKSGSGNTGQAWKHQAVETPGSRNIRHWEYLADVGTPGVGTSSSGNTWQAWKHQAVETSGSGKTRQWEHQAGVETSEEVGIPGGVEILVKRNRGYGSKN